MSIQISSKQFSFNKEINTFKVDGRSVPFATRYTLLNEKSGKEMEFFFSHSTGSEWDVDTKWIYRSFNEEFILEMGNEDVTPFHANNYLNAKLRN